jgi:tetratricopeptide (TPR) repeat protein
MTNDREPGGGPEDLEDEREFLLRSLDDLDNELIAGNIDPDTYRVLHDDYTARASAVIRSIADGVERGSPDAPRVPTLMRVLTIGGIAVFAVLAAILLAHTAGQRRPGQQITGDAQSKGSPTTVSAAAEVAAAKVAASAAPKSYDARIRYARALLGSGVYSAAVQEYIVAANLDPTQPEPLAYTGWLTALFARGETKLATKTALLDAAVKSLDRAIAVDSTYPDSYVFKGLLYSQIENKQCAGAIAFEQFLVTAPDDHPMRQQVLSALEQAVKAGKCPSPTTTPTTKP